MVMNNVTLFNVIGRINVMYRRIHIKIGSKNAGINKQLRALDVSVENLELDAADLDTYESDFFAVGQSYKQHQREVALSKELTSYHIVKQKYFKVHTPNYLTWADKQQIKHLYTSNPDEWTIERLVEGFPALEDTIKKVIKGNWVPRDVKRIKKHDANVLENWKQFKAGNADDLPEELLDHLKNFTSRSVNLNVNYDNFTVQNTNEMQLVKKQGEFSQIITNYQELKKATLLPKQNVIQTLPPLPVKKENEPVKKNLKVQLMTYNEMQEQIGFIEDVKTDTTETMPEIVLSPEELNMVKFKSNNAVNLYKPVKNYSQLLYPEFINIPKNKLKKGSTYRLNDCFYDSDGMFLYRVPGLY